jgi:hypothetical protein
VLSLYGDFDLMNRELARQVDGRAADLMCRGDCSCWSAARAEAARRISAENRARVAPGIDVQPASGVMGRVVSTSTGPRGSGGAA